MANPTLVNYLKVTYRKVTLFRSYGHILFSRVFPQTRLMRQLMKSPNPQSLRLLEKKQRVLKQA